MSALLRGGDALRAGRPAGWQARVRPEVAVGGRRQLWVVLGFAAHAPLAILVSRYPSVGAVHAYASLAVGLAWAVAGRHPWRVAYAAAYIVGAELLWRMTGAPIFWEFAKYALSALFLAGTWRFGSSRNSILAVSYFALLIPSALVTLAADSLPVAVNNLSFNLSGPLALTSSVLFFSRLRLSLTCFRRLLLIGAAPLIGVSTIVWRGVSQADTVAFGRSNVTLSGGFAPNQVSSMLGWGVLLLALYLVSGRSGAFFGPSLLGVLLLFATQSALTFSRGGMYLAAISTAAASLFLLREGRFRRRLALGFGVVLAAAFFVIIPRMLSFTRGTIASRFAETSTTGRAEMVRADLDTWLSAPILGVGPGQGKANRARFFRFEASHTEFSRMLAEHGFFGLAAMGCLIALVGRAIRAPASSVSRALRMAMLTWGVLFMLIDGVRVAAPGLALGLALATLTLAPASRARNREGAPARRGPLEALPGRRGAILPSGEPLEDART